MFKIFFLFFFSTAACFAGIMLKDNLDKAVKGDFIVTCQNKNYTVMLIQDKSNGFLGVEEISIPSHSIGKNHSWREWLGRGAPSNTCWVRYVINMETGKVQNYYSVTQGQWLDTSKANQFLSTLLNLNFAHVPHQERKRIARGGGTDVRNLWQPPMIVEGRIVPQVPFEAWKTHWPRDGSELGGKEIVVYLPAENDKYPTYFPYWLQISGLVEKAKIRIVDSGKGTVEKVGAVVEKERVVRTEGVVETDSVVGTVGTEKIAETENVVGAVGTVIDNSNDEQVVES